MYEEMISSYLEDEIKKGALWRNLTLHSCTNEGSVQSFDFCLYANDGSLAASMRKSCLTGNAPPAVAQKADLLRDFIDFYVLGLAKTRADYFDNMIIVQRGDWIFDTVRSVYDKMDEAGVQRGLREIIVPADWEQDLLSCDRFRFYQSGVWVFFDEGRLARITPTMYLKKNIVAATAAWATANISTEIDDQTDPNTIKGRINLWYNPRGGKNDICLFSIAK